MRYFLISALCLLVSCGSYPKRNSFKEVASSESRVYNPYFSDTAQDYVYRADIQLYNKSFSGIFVAKKLGANHHRVVFTTEMGNKIFDFLFGDGDFKINYLLPDMNKKLVVNLLRKDFRTLLKEQLDLEASFSSGDVSIKKTSLNGELYYFYDSSQRLQKIIGTRGPKAMVIYNFSEISNTNAKNIQILHQNIKLSIALKAI